MLTEGVDYADASKSTHDDVADTFKFTDASEKITATFAQLSKGDQLIDLSNADNDTLALSLDINNVKQTIGSKNGATLVNIEELDITSRGAKNITFDNTISAAGLKTIKIAGSFLNEKGNDGNGFTFNGNVLKTLTTIDASAITAGNVNIDASKATQDLTITGPNFAASINGGSGNDTITGQGTINGGSGNDTIDASTAIGAVTIIDGSGADTIKGGAGNDDITLTNGDKDSDTIIFAATAAANGKDTITGFTAGPGGDVLNFAAFLGNTIAISGASGSGLGDGGSGVAISTSGFDAAASGAGNVIYVKDVTSPLTKANFGSSAGEKNVIKVATETNYVVIAKDTANNTNTIYYVEVGTDETNATVTPVGTINTLTNAFVADNFA